MTQKVSDIMTPDPTTLDVGATVAATAATMADQGIGDVLVTKGGTVIGLVTDRDLVVRVLAAGLDPGRTTIEDVCSREMFSVSPDEDVERAIELIRKRSVRRVPVLQNNDPVGIITIGDLAIERDERSALANVSAAPPNT